MVAAILSLGNITFVAGKDEEYSVVPPGAPEQFLATTAELLGVDREGLLKALTTRTRQTPDGPIVSPLDAKAALENRDSLAKILYSKVSSAGGRIGWLRTIALYLLAKFRGYGHRRMNF